MERFVACCLLAGCDVMFKIKTVDEPILDATLCGTPDEDGDCVADDVDNCPGIANAQQRADGEADTPGGVGDVCDPDVDRAGNVIKLFSGFNDPAADANVWMNHVGGTNWMFMDGFVAQPRYPGIGILRRIVVDDDADLTIEAKFVYRGLQPDAVDARMAIWVDLPEADIDGQTCWATPTSNRVYVQENSNVGTGGTTGVNIPPLAIGAQVTLQMRRDRAAGQVYCRAIIDGASFEVGVVGQTTPWPTMNHVGIQARFLAADLEYVTLYRR